MSHQEFDRMLTKYLPSNTLRNIQDVVESLKSKVRRQAHSSQHLASKSWRRWF